MAYFLVVYYDRMRYIQTKVSKQFVKVVNNRRNKYINQFRQLT